MHTLEVDTEKALKNLVEEYTTKDMNEDPEVEGIENLAERRNAARQWLERRLNQLDVVRDDAIRDLDRARHAGYLPLGDHSRARGAYSDAFEVIKNGAIKRYEAAVAEVVGT